MEHCEDCNKPCKTLSRYGLCRKCQREQEEFEVQERVNDHYQRRAESGFAQ